MGELDDLDFVDRLLAARVRFLPRFEDREAAMLWQATFEGHQILVGVFDEDASGRTTLIIDGEPSGEIDDWPPRWERL